MSISYFPVFWLTSLTLLLGGSKYTVSFSKGKKIIIANKKTSSLQLQKSLTQKCINLLKLFILPSHYQGIFPQDSWGQWMNNKWCVLYILILHRPGQKWQICSSPQIQVIQDSWYIRKSSCSFIQMGKLYGI